MPPPTHTPLRGVKWPRSRRPATALTRIRPAFDQYLTSTAVAAQPVQRSLERGRPRPPVKLGSTAGQARASEAGGADDDVLDGGGDVLV